MPFFLQFRSSWMSMRPKAAKVLACNLDPRTDHSTYDFNVRHAPTNHPLPLQPEQYTSPLFTMAGYVHSAAIWLGRPPDWRRDSWLYAFTELPLEGPQLTVYSWVYRENRVPIYQREHQKHDGLRIWEKVCQRSTEELDKRVARLLCAPTDIVRRGSDGTEGAHIEDGMLTFHAIGSRQVDGSRLQDAPLHQLRCQHVHDGPHGVCKLSGCQEISTKIITRSRDTRLGSARTRLSHTTRISEFVLYGLINAQPPCTNDQEVCNKYQVSFVLESLLPCVFHWSL